MPKLESVIGAPVRNLITEDRVAINKAAVTNLIQTIVELRDHAESLGLDRTASRLKQAISAAKYQLKRL